jgi:putative methionine-R-sulfoxide reductase with GAF domain
LIAVLDIDSNQLNPFDAVDRNTSKQFVQSLRTSNQEK